MAEVQISYKGSAIAQMNASGTKTLLTEGKYLEDDVTVEYTRPSTPSPTLITKTITENGTYDASDDNADGYSEVTVNVSGGGVTLAPMDYPVKLTNNRSGNVSFNKIFYNSVSLIYAVAANIGAGATATFNNMLTDGTHIWFCTSNNITNIKYNGENATYALYNGRNAMLTIPAGFDGTIPFEVYF